MVKIKILGSGGVQFLENDLITTFNGSRQKIKEEKVVSPLQTLDFQPYPFVSVLATGSGCELYYQDSTQKICKKPLTCAGTMVVSALMSKSPIRVLKESGKLEGVAYTHIVFVFNQTKPVEELLSGVLQK